MPIPFKLGAFFETQSKKKTKGSRFCETQRRTRIVEIYNSSSRISTLRFSVEYMQCNVSISNNHIINVVLKYGEKKLLFLFFNLSNIVRKIGGHKVI